MPKPPRTGVLAATLLAAAAFAQDQQPALLAPQQDAPNVYNLEPFRADFPVPLQYPNKTAREYDRTRRQMLAQLAANLQGNVRPEAWHFATEFFGHAPEDAAEPLIETMDRALGNPVHDVVRNCVEAMGKMGDPRFEPSLQRAIEQHNVAVRESAMNALAACARPETLRAMSSLFRDMPGRSRAVWLRQVRIRLGHDAVPLLRQHMMADYPTAVRDQVLKETLAMPVADAAEILRGRWPEALGEFKAIIAGIFHAAGETTGTTWLRDALQSEDIPTLTLALRNSVFGDPGPLREMILRATTHARPEVRLAAAMVLTKVEGDDVAAVYEVLAAPDEPWDIKSIAIRELTRRGKPGVVTVLLDELHTATGSRLQELLSQLAASGDERAVPIFVERFETAPATEGRPFVQALSQNGSNAAVDALLVIFSSPERVVARSSQGSYTTLNYLPTLLANLRGHEKRIVAAFRDIPRDDYRHRAALLPTVVGIANDRREPTLTAEVLEIVRGILFDTSELPQMRVLALNQLVPNFLSIDDALRLKNSRFGEKGSMRVLFTDFLNDYL